MTTEERQIKNPKDPASGEVFLSYAGVDRVVASRLAKGLGGAGVNIWWDREGIGWGDNWVEKLQNKLAECGAYLILVGRSGIRRWVKAELWLAIKRHFESGLPIFPVLLADVDPEGLPPFLSIFQAHSLPANLTTVDFAELADALGRVSAEQQHPQAIDYGVCPFPGLEPYRERDKAFFFGRQTETLEVLRLLGTGLDGVEHRWVNIEGPSGVGKSSLVQAGLLPSIRAGWLNEDSGQDYQWVVALMRPGNRPIQALATELERALGEQETISSSMRARIDDIRKGQDAGALAYALRLGLAGDKRLLLVVDQFEEIFTQTEATNTRARFDALVTEALTDMDCPLYLMTTIRSDFMLRFGQLSHLQSLLNQRAGRYFLTPIGALGLSNVVRSPATRARLGWSEQTLPKRIIKNALSAQESALPLVSYLLRLLWERSKERQDGLLSAVDYETLGGVGGALARVADGLLDLPTKERERARRLLLALVKPGGRESEDTRRTITLDMALKAAGGGDTAQDIINRLSGLQSGSVRRATPRIIVVSSKEEAPDEKLVHTVELAHETLLRTDQDGKPYWKTLRDWVNDYRRQLEEWDFVQSAATDWEAKGQPITHLWPQERLDLVYEALTNLGLKRETLEEPVRTFTRPEAERLCDELQRPETDHYRRAEIGDRLDRIGDRRSGVGLRKDGLPDIDWVAIKGGKVKLEEGAGDFEVEPFDIARYPITWLQYRAFVDAPKGYDNKQWWEDLKHEKSPGRQYRRFGNCPADNVSWYDAMAFCRWLTARFHEQGIIPRDSVVRLPTEWEWQQATTGGDPERIYPWGTEWREGLANTSESGLSRTIAVGMYPKGAWTSGPLDLAGNVWERCLNKYQEPRKTAPDVSDDSRVVRGGSWINSQGLARTGFRFDLDPNYRDHHFGFRVCCASPID